MSTRTAVRRTVLAVPGSSDRFITKRGRCRGIVPDLEDAVAPQSGVGGASWSVERSGGFLAQTVTVRVNDWRPWTYADVIEVVTGAGARWTRWCCPSARLQRR